MNKDDLEKTLFNDRYGDEILRQIRSSNKGSLNTHIDWIVTNPNLVTFASTVTFKNLVRADRGMKESTLYEYQKRVLNKVRRRLARSSSKCNMVLPIDYLTLYEYRETSFYKSISERKRGFKHHHVHGIFSVAKEYADRIFDFNAYYLDDRLFKDIKSIPTVVSFKIEPLILEESDSWVRYIAKGKDFTKPLFD